MPDDVKRKAKAGRALFDALCAFADECGSPDGQRLRSAVDAVGETIGEDGFEALRRGDVVGCALEALRNHRRRPR